MGQFLELTFYLFSELFLFPMRSKKIRKEKGMVQQLKDYWRLKTHCLKQIDLINCSQTHPLYQFQDPL